uniref:Uncharacterized protein n=1 Tax=Globodera rostochiensis TaxID=31243 RepID=A0A914H6I3_GLORO
MENEVQNENTAADETEVGAQSSAGHCSPYCPNCRRLLGKHAHSILVVKAANEFDATVWREHFLDELKAKNALTVESPDLTVMPKNALACLEGHEF